MNTPGKTLSFKDELFTATWLKSRDVLSRTGSPFKTVLVILGLGVIVGLLCTGAYMAATMFGRPVTILFTLASIIWPLWAVVPLLSGGAGEVSSAKSLAPYPVSSRTQMFFSWVAAFLDFPYLVVLPVLLVVSYAAGGPVGVLAALCFTLSASAFGQVGAWTLARLVSPRKNPALVLLTGALTAFAALILVRSGRFETVSSYLPAGHLQNTIINYQNSSAWFIVWFLILLVPAGSYLLFGPWLVQKALQAESQAKGQGARKPSWFLTTTKLKTRVYLGTIFLVSMLRSTAAQAMLIGVALVPLVLQFASADGTLQGGEIITLIIVVSAAATVAVNSFGFDGGGVLYLLSAPVKTKTLLISRFAALTFLLTLTQLFGVLVYVIVSGENLNIVSLTAGVLSQASLFAALGVRWSVRHPAAADFDSLRTRVTSPRSVITFLLSGVSFTVLFSISSVIPNDFIAGLVLLTLTGLLVWLYIYRSVKDFTKEGSSRVAETLASS